MPWIRVTHANSGLPLDVNLDLSMSMYALPNGSTEVQAAPNFVYTIRENPDEVWAAIKAASQKPFTPESFQPFVQVAKPIKVQKTSARPKKTRDVRGRGHAGKLIIRRK